MDRTLTDCTPEPLDSETLQAIDEGVEAAANGRRWSLEEAVAFARKRREEWTKIPVTQNA